MNSKLYRLGYDMKATSSYGTDGLLAGATVTVLLGGAQHFFGVRFEYPGFEAALVVLLSYAYASLAARKRETE